MSSYCDRIKVPKLIKLMHFERHYREECECNNRS